MRPLDEETVNAFEELDEVAALEIMICEELEKGIELLTGKVAELEKVVEELECAITWDESADEEFGSENVLELEDSSVLLDVADDTALEVADVVALEVADVGGNVGELRFSLAEENVSWLEEELNLTESEECASEEYCISSALGFRASKSTSMISLSDVHA